ncbi:MAG: YegP family protein [Chitinophagaceae bacterium]|nr:YegP family protein [Chitinophagaceae bacterium]
MAKFIITIQKDGLYYFHLKATNGQILLTSEGYTSKMGCMNGIEATKLSSVKRDRYILKETANGEYFFHLKAANGQVLGISKRYATEANRNAAIDSIINIGQTSLVLDAA